MVANPEQTMATLGFKLTGNAITDLDYDVLTAFDSPWLPATAFKSIGMLLVL